MSKTCYIGLDLSLTGTGIVAVVSPEMDTPMSAKMGRVVHQDVVGYALTMEASVKEKTERMLETAKSVIKTVKAMSKEGYDVEVAIENYAFSTVKNKKGKSFQSSSQTGLAELHGIIKSQLLLATGLSPVMYSVKTARMVVFGNGNFPKVNVKPALNKWGYEFKKMDDADAFVIAECHRKKLEGWTDERKRSKKRSKK